MAILLSTVGTAFAAFCVWLGARIVNRQERWAKWTAVALLLLLAYPLSIGPVCWLERRGWMPEWTRKPTDALYAPLLTLATVGAPDDSWLRIGPFGGLLFRYMLLWTDAQVPAVVSPPPTNSAPVNP